jgi:hypothetical protein
MKPAEIHKVSMKPEETGLSMWMIERMPLNTSAPRYTCSTSGRMSMSRTNVRRMHAPACVKHQGAEAA